MSKKIKKIKRKLQQLSSNKKSKIQAKKVTKVKQNQAKKIKRAESLGKQRLKVSKKKSVILSSKKDSDIFLFSEDNVQVYKQTIQTIKSPDSDKLWPENTSITSEIGSMDSLVKKPQDGISLGNGKNSELNNGIQQTIHINKVSQQKTSPHIVDLKNRNFYTERALSHLPPKLTWEEKIAQWDQKFQKVKTNFITPELNDYKYQRDLFKNQKNQKPNFIKRFWLRVGAAIGSAYQYIIESFSRWGENKTEEILQLAAQTTDNIQTNDYLLASSKKQPGLMSTDILVSLKVFVLIALVLVIPLQGYTYYHNLRSQREMVLGATSSIYDDFQQGFAAFEQLDFSTANNRFSEAQSNLHSVNKILEKYPSFLISLAKIIPSFGQEVSSGLYVMAAGNKMAELGINLSNLFSDLQTHSSNNIEILQALQLGLNNSFATLQEIEDLLAKVDVDSLPDGYREQFVQLNNILPQAKDVFKNAAAVSMFASDWLGANEPQRYLLVFQNSNELRPTGGFIGSIAEVDIKNGEIQNFYLPPGGVYDLQGNLKILLAAPEPLRLLNANWQLQDSNWFFDFPTSAKKIIWFYEKSGGPTVDGVIAVNSQILPKILAITGPIELKEFNLVLTADNVIAELQSEVEINYDRELNQPKKIIASLMPIILQRLENLPPQDFFSTFSLLYKALQVRDIQLYHQQDNLQSEILHFGFGGQVQSADHDYLAIVDTNIGGGKTDQVISSQVLLTSNINSNGEIINTLKIIKQHNGDSTDLFTGHTYRDYIRVYVPLGSKLISATGFNPPDPAEFNDPEAGYSEDDFLKKIETNEIIDLETKTRITDEFNKTVFGNWLSLTPGEQKEVSLTYILPNKVDFKKTNQDNYFISIVNNFLNNLGLSEGEENEVAMHTLLLQKQSGQPPYSFSHEIIFPNSWNVSVSNLLKDNTARRDNRVYYQNTVISDQIWGIIFSR